MSTQTQGQAEWLTDWLKWDTEPFVFSISTICIPSPELPQPIQTAAVLDRASHTTLPTESHYWAPANNDTFTANINCFTVVSLLKDYLCFNFVRSPWNFWHSWTLILLSPLGAGWDSGYCPSLVCFVFIRQIFLCWNGKFLFLCSSISCGVPQESILGPTLFAPCMLPLGHMFCFTVMLTIPKSIHLWVMVTPPLIGSL